MTLIAFRAHVTTAAGQSLRLGVLASGRSQADATLEHLVPNHRGAQLLRVRGPLRLERSYCGEAIYPTGSRHRDEAANTAPTTPLHLA